MDDWIPALKPFSSLFDVRLASGNEALRFRNGSMVGLVSTTRRAGHGGTLDQVVIDEAFAQPDARLEQSLKPTLLTRENAQIWVVSTAGTPVDSPWLLQKVEKGRASVQAGLRKGVAYFEWSAEEDADPGDPATWASAMPALGITVPEESVAADFATMDLSEFRRAYLNLWTKTMTVPVIDLDAWAALADPASQLKDPVVFAVDVTPDRGMASIAAAGRRPDGLVHLEIVDHYAGTGWVADRLAELVHAHRTSAVVLDPAGPAGSVIGDLERQRVKVHAALGSREHAEACGLFFDGVAGAKLRHLGTQELTEALTGAVRRPLGDAWAWSRKSSKVDISPLVAVTLAHWGVETLAAKRVRPRFISLNDPNI